MECGITECLKGIMKNRFKYLVFVPPLLSIDLLVKVELDESWIR